MVSGPGPLPRDQLVLEYHRLPGAATEHPGPPRRWAGVRPHPERDRDYGARLAGRHGELPGRRRCGRGPERTPAIRRAEDYRPAGIESTGVRSPGRADSRTEMVTASAL